MKNGNKPTVMAFQECGDGSLTQIVVRKGLFKSKEDFLNYCLTENDDLETEFEGVENIPHYSIDAVKEGYVRYYSHFPQDMGMGIDSGYTFCEKSKGAIEVYILDLDGLTDEKELFQDDEKGCLNCEFTRVEDDKEPCCKCIEYSEWKTDEWMHK